MRPLHAQSICGGQHSESCPGGRPIDDLKHDLVIKFLRGARSPSHQCSVPSWDLYTVFRALRDSPFEPLETLRLSSP